MKPLQKILFLFLLLSSSAFAQKDSIIGLKEVNVSSYKLTVFANGLRQYAYDSTLVADYINRSLSDLLNDNGAISQKNYGPGELATTSLRGGSSYQTAILWNGFSLANSMHGLTDLSLLQNFFFDDVTVQYGGTSFLWGSGAVSGSIHLDNEPSFNKGLVITAGASAGSFSDYTQYGKIIYGLKNFSATLRFFNCANKNNFNYIDKNTGTEEQQIQSSIKQNGVMGDVSFRTGKYGVLNFRGWYSYSNRQIPPGLLTVNSEGVQKDVDDRYSAEWKTTYRKLLLSVRSAFFQEKINYDNDFFLQPSVNTGRNIISEAEGRILFSGNHVLQFGIDNTFSYANPSDYSFEARLNRLSLFSSYHYNSSNQKLELSAGIRKEFSSLQNSPFIFSGGMNYSPVKNILFRLAASNVYRNPTLNDLYWNPGGNPALKPEDGYSAETGIRINIPGILAIKNNNHVEFTIESTIYYKKINNWIVWNPTATSDWSAQNLKLVESHGSENVIHFMTHGKNISYGGDFEFFHTISTNEKVNLVNDASLHCQLIYVPEYRWNFRLFIVYKNFGLRFNHSYTGYRYTTSDNSEYLDPYHLSNIQIDKIIPAGKSQIRIYFSVNNIFNTDYQSVMNRPMPLISYDGGITISFRKNLNHTIPN